MIKVCHFTSAHESTDTRIFHKECVSLAKAGYETYLVAKGESREEAGVHIIGVGDASASRIKRMLCFSRRIYNVACSLDCDIYHFHDPELLPYGLKLKKRGKKVIFDSHENTAAQIKEKSYIPHCLRQLISRAYSIRETLIIRKLDAVITPCTFDGKNIFDKRARKTVYIANYPKKELFSGHYDAQEKKEFDICYVGALSYGRGIYHLVKAAGIGDFRLLLAGRFDSKEFENQIRSMPEFANVTYVGEVPHGEVADIIQKCRVGSHTLLDVGQYYHVDTFGNKILEYMSLGLPVIMNESLFAKKMVERVNFGVCVRPDAPEEIANAVNYLLNNPEIAFRMGENGRKAVEEEFNWTTQENKIIELYGELEK